MKNAELEMRRFHDSAFFLLHSSWLFQIVAAINDAGVEEAAGLGDVPHPVPLPVGRGEGRARGFAPEIFLAMRSLRGKASSVNFLKSGNEKPACLLLRPILFRRVGGGLQLLEDGLLNLEVGGKLFEFFALRHLRLRQFFLGGFQIRSENRWPAPAPPAARRH